LNDKKKQNATAHKRENACVFLIQISNPRKKWDGRKPCGNAKANGRDKRHKEDPMRAKRERSRQKSGGHPKERSNANKNQQERLFIHLKQVESKRKKKKREQKKETGKYNPRCGHELICEMAR